MRNKFERRDKLEMHSTSKFVNWYLPASPQVHQFVLNFIIRRLVRAVVEELREGQALGGVCRASCQQVSRSSNARTGM
jgi:hypothetical protein